MASPKLFIATLGLVFQIILPKKCDDVVVLISDPDDLQNMITLLNGKLKINDNKIKILSNTGTNINITLVGNVFETVDNCTYLGQKIMATKYGINAKNLRLRIG